MSQLDSKIKANDTNLISRPDNLNKNNDKETKDINQKRMQSKKELILSPRQQNEIKDSNNIISKSEINQEKINFKMDNISSSLMPTSQLITNNLNPEIFQNEKGEFKQTQKYINYLKTHLDSSYYAFNEIKNKNSTLLSKLKSINDEIKKSNIIYQKLLKSIELKTKENNEYKSKYEKILKENFELDDKIEKMKGKNIILIKENESKEEIIRNLRKTLDVLENNKKEKNKEKKERLNELIKEKISIDKLKKEFDDIGKELIDKNRELVETKETILNLLKQKKEDYELLNILENNGDN